MMTLALIGGLLLIGMFVMFGSIVTTIVLESVFSLHVMPNTVDKSDPQIFQYIMLVWFAVFILILEINAWYQKRKNKKARDLDENS